MILLYLTQSHYKAHLATTTIFKGSDGGKRMRDLVSNYPVTRMSILLFILFLLVHKHKYLYL